MRRNRTLTSLIVALVLVGAIAVGGVTYRLAFADECGGSSGVYEPVGYGSFRQATEQSDAALVITMDAQPSGTYCDRDIKQELVTGTVDRVLHGDPALEGTQITLSQFPLESLTAQQAGDHLAPGKTYLVLASLADFAESKPPVDGPVWVTLLGGQGIFEVNQSGKVRPSIPGVFPELFGTDGLTAVSLDDL